MDYNATYHASEDKTLKCHINVYSYMNDWMDYTFIVPTEHTDDAIATLEKAWDAWWEDEGCETMFDTLETALFEAGIPFESLINEEDFT